MNTLRTPTRKERYQIYQIALSHYREMIGSKNSTIFGMCWSMDHARSKLTEVTGKYYSNPYDNMKDAYPEIYKHRPKRFNKSNYWFPLDNTEKRINIFIQAKRETR